MPYDLHHAYETSDIVPGTGDWLLSDPLYCAWSNGEDEPILWLHGISGVGKTKLW